MEITKLTSCHRFRPNRILKIYLVLVCVCLVQVWSPPPGTDHPQTLQLKFQKILMAAGCPELLLWRQIRNESLPNQALIIMDR